MKYRIAMWAAVGFIVAGFWALYFYLLPTASPIVSTQPMTWVIARATCPIAFASLYFHFPVSIYMAFVANAATYAFVGLIAETLRRQLNHA